MNSVKKIDVRDAIGRTIAHDMTQIIKGERKGPRFKKGHVIQEEDIEVLLSMGKEHIYVIELDENTYHENEAAEHLANICSGQNTSKSELSEGRINIFSSVEGIAKINISLLEKINACDDVMVSTVWNNSVVKQGQVLAGTRAIPLFIAKEKIQCCEEIAKNEKIVNVIQFKNLKVAVLATGNEVFYGKIKDGFKDTLPQKLAEYNAEIVEYRYSTDESSTITKHIEELLKLDVDLILCTGGMSVDPDDNTPLAIKSASTEVVTYGTPVLPGAMFMVAYHNDIPILGLPGAVMYYSKTVFDLIMPRIAIGEHLTKEDIIHMGHGGLL